MSEIHRQPGPTRSCYLLLYCLVCVAIQTSPCASFGQDISGPNTVSPLVVRPANYTIPELRSARWAERDLPEWRAGGQDVPPTPVDLSVGVGNMSMADLESMALSNNPTLSQAAQQLSALQGKYIQVGLKPNPLIGYAGDEIGDEGRAGLQGAFLAQKFVTAGKLGLNRAMVTHEIASAHADVEIQRHRVLNDVRAVSYQVIAAQRMIDLATQLANLGDEGVSVTEELMKAQVASRIDLLQARIEANSARLLRDNAHNEFQTVWHQLAAVVGVPQLETARIEDTLDDERPRLTWHDSWNNLSAGSPELARARASFEQAQCALARAQAGSIPDFTIQASSRYNYGPENAVASVNVAVPLQLFDRNQGNIHRAQAELAQAQREIRRVELALQDRLAQAFRRYGAAQQRVDRYSGEIVPDAKQSLDLALEAYRQGELGYLDLLNSQRTYFQTSLALVESLRDLRVSGTRIEGLLLSGGLTAVGQ